MRAIVLNDALQHLAAGAAANRVGGDQPGALRLACFDLGAGFLEPVGDEDRRRRARGLVYDRAEASV